MDMDTSKLHWGHQEYNLGEFAEKFKDSFPKIINVTVGFLGQQELDSISSSTVSGISFIWYLVILSTAWSYFSTVVRGSNNECLLILYISKNGLFKCFDLQFLFYWEYMKECRHSRINTTWNKVQLLCSLCFLPPPTPTSQSTPWSTSCSASREQCLRANTGKSLPVTISTVVFYIIRNDRQEGELHSYVMWIYNILPTTLRMKV